MLGWFCRTFPLLKPLFLGVGYLMLIIAGLVWFICFPLTVYTLYMGNVFPLAYFGDTSLSDPGVNYWLPEDMRRPLGGVCVGFTLYGLFVLYYNVANLRRLRRGEKPKSRFADADAAMGITPEFDKRDGMK